jgi:hypothetical protein
MQITFNIPDAQVPRIKAWMLSRHVQELDAEGNPLPLPTDAELLAEFKLSVRRWIKGEVQQYELLKEHDRVYAEYTQIDVTE